MEMKNLKRILITSILIIILSTLHVFAADNKEPEVYSPSVILIESDTGKILYEKNSNEQMYPASTTKMMTAILALENCNLDDVATVSYNAVMTVPAGYSIAALQIGEELTVEQLLKVLLIHSANDAANVLAEHIAGSIEAFSEMMNKKAIEIGCENTNFVNPSGIHNSEHFSSAYDLALIAKYAMENETFRNIVSQTSCTIEPTNKYDERTFRTTNDLLIYNNVQKDSNYYYPYAIGIKTGYTSQAKNCLVSAANKDGIELIAVVLGAMQTSTGLSERYLDTIELFYYGYENYTMTNLKTQGDIITNITVDHATKDTKSLDLTISDDLKVLIKNENLGTEITPEIKLNDGLSAPIKQGDIVGTVTYTVEGIEYTANLIASHSVEKWTFIKLLLEVILLIITLYVIYYLIFKSNRKNKKSNKTYKYKI